MKLNLKLIASSGLVAALVTIGTSNVRAQSGEAWATAGSPNGGGPYAGGGAAAYDALVGGGGFNFHNGPIIGNWDDFADFGTLIFNATFQNTSFDNTSMLTTNYIQPFGVPPDLTATYGQTFIDPTGAGKLTSFSFFLQGSDAPFSVQAFAMTWNGGLIGGEAHDESAATILYASEPFTFTSNGAAWGSGTWEEVTATIGGGGLALTAGDDYLIGLSTLGVGELTPTGPGISAPDTTSTLVLLGVALGAIVLLQRRLRLV